MTDTPDIESVIAARVAAAKREVLEELRATMMVNRSKYVAIFGPVSDEYVRGCEMALGTLDDTLTDHLYFALPPTGDPT